MKTAEKIDKSSLMKCAWALWKNAQWRKRLSLNSFSEALREAWSRLKKRLAKAAESARLMAEWYSDPAHRPAKRLDLGDVNPYEGGVPGVTYWGD